MKTVTFDKYTQFRHFHIFEPRWHDHRVLLKDSKFKVGKTPHNKITISGEAKDGGRYYQDLYITTAEARKYPLQSNGVIMCRAIPLEAFSELKITQRSLHDVY